MNMLYITVLNIFMLMFVHFGQTLPVKENSNNDRILLLIDNDGKLYFSDDKLPSLRVDVDEDEVTFHYKSRQTSSPLELTVFNVDKILQTDFDVNRRTMFIIHGWNNNKDSEMNIEISEALLKAEDWNVFVVDWREKANSLYPTALGSVPAVGQIVSKFIMRLQQITGVSISSINLSGHSLGAHVAGYAGYNVGGQIDSIVGMDPAYPFVEATIDTLETSDAKFVQVIHCTGGLLGFLKPLGHADFYPNGGKRQKGCVADVLGICGHSRCHKYFAESITNNNFKSRLCPSEESWSDGECNNNPVAYMGGNQLQRENGIYYLNTAAKSPFALG